MNESAIHSKYIDMVSISAHALSSFGAYAKCTRQFQDLKRAEREHAKEKQKLVKDKDASKSQLTKANASKTKLENLARVAYDWNCRVSR